MIGRLLIAGIAVALLTGAAPVAAQQNFPDVPENHWAYEALLTLKRDGLLVGYPDGTFGGPRPLSRYEFAAATHRAYMLLSGMLQDKDGLIEDLERRIRSIEFPEEGDTSGLATKQDLQALKDQLAALRADARSLGDFGDDIAALKKLMEEFSQDLASLGVDAAQVERDIRGLEQRITALENRKPPVTISGDVNVVGFGGHSEGGHIGTSWTGNPVGSDSSGDPANLVDDLHIVHESALNLSGDYGRDVHMEAEVIFSTLLPYEFSSFSSISPTSRKDESISDILVHHLTADWDTEWFGAPTSVTLGRTGYASSNYFAYYRLDPDPYVDIERWDDHKWYFDGAVFDFELGSADLTFLGGKIADLSSVHGSGVWPMMVGWNFGWASGPGRPGNYYRPLGLDVETQVGTELTFEFANGSHAAAQYFLLDGQETTLPGNPVSDAVVFNRMAVMGADTTVNLSKELTFYGTFANADLYYNDKVRQADDNHAFDLALEYHQGEKWWLGAGYRYVAPFFSAPGYWDRIGYWYNPVDIEGFAAWFYSQFGSGKKFWLAGQLLSGTESLSNPGGSNAYGLNHDDEILNIHAYVSLPLSKKLTLVAGWEGVFWDFEGRPDFDFAGGRIDENYYTAEFTFDLGEATSFRIGYQFSDIENKTGVSFFNPAGNTSDPIGRGGLIFTQFSLGF